MGILGAPPHRPVSTCAGISPAPPLFLPLSFLSLSTIEKSNQLGSVTTGQWTHFNHVPCFNNKIGISTDIDTGDLRRTGSVVRHFPPFDIQPQGRGSNAWPNGDGAPFRSNGRIRPESGGRPFPNHSIEIAKNSFVVTVFAYCIVWIYLLKS